MTHKLNTRNIAIAAEHFSSSPLSKRLQACCSQDLSKHWTKDSGAVVNPRDRNVWLSCICNSQCCSPFQIMAFLFMLWFTLPKKGYFHFQIFLSSMNKISTKKNSCWGSAKGSSKECLL